MEHTLIRNERREAPDGSGATEIFICLEMDDGVEMFNFGYWLTPIEVAAVLANEAATNDGSAMNGVIAKAVVRGERTFNAYKRQRDQASQN